MDEILHKPKMCQCFDCLKKNPTPLHLLPEFQSLEPTEKMILLRHMYYAKPFNRSSWSDVWKSVTHRDYAFPNDYWSGHFSEQVPIEEFTQYLCKKWCDRQHNPPVYHYTTPPMPYLFEEPREAIYKPPRKCESVQGQDFTWKEDYRPKGTFPGWCLKGNPPDFEDCDKD